MRATNPITPMLLTGFAISMGAVQIMRVWVFASTHPLSPHEGRLSRSPLPFRGAGSGPDTPVLQSSATVEKRRQTRFYYPEVVHVSLPP